MNRTEKRLLQRTVQLGLVLTLLVIIVDSLGVLGPLERYLYDLRARRCQYFTPPPSEKIVHLDIDDQSLQDIGAFPWPRTKLAEMVDEIRLAGAKVIGFDVIFPEAQETRFQPDADGKMQTIEDDRNFADAMKRAGNVLIPLSVSPQAPDRPAILDPLVQVLKSDLEMDVPTAVSKLRGTRFETPRLEAVVKSNFTIARERAMFERVSELNPNGQAQLDQLEQSLTPRAFASGESSDATNLLHTTIGKVQSVQRLMSFTLPMPPDMPNLLTSDQELATIAPLAESAAFCGAADFIPEKDGIVRSVPLFVNYRGRLMPHMSFAAACAMLDVKLSDLKINADSVTLPLKDGTSLRIPVRSVSSQQFGTVGMFMNIPWFGGSGPDAWLTMYDWPAHLDTKQHFSLRTVWEIGQIVRNIEKNNRETDTALFAVNKVYPSEKTAAFLARTPDQRTDAARAEVVDVTLKDMSELADIPALEKARPGDLKEDDQKYLATFKALRRLREVDQRLATDIRTRRTQLHGQFDGRYVLVGWTATGTGDFKTTSLHPQCPGVVIQGVVDNALLTGQVWKSSPWIVGAFFAVIVGLLTTAAVALLPAYLAMICTLLFAGGYLVLNGIVFFDYGNWIVDAAGPLTTGAIVWSALTLARNIDETRERRKITRRFSSYVDPMLVNFVMENPDTARFDGLEKEMTVVFTDLAGFTTISEKLRERTVPLLNEYMSLMLPIIRENRGYWNKFLGDGIMFFFNAPADSPTHARDSVRTILQMQKAVEQFNKSLFKRELPAVGMRAGIATGLMVVGDAGSTDIKHHASDYTVLGDSVNLGARLEPANKSFESQMLMTERTVELLDSEFLVRPVGKLQVVGKTEGIMTFEAICLRAEAQDQHRSLMEWSTRVVDSFRTAKFKECLDAARKMESEVAPSKFTKLYQKLSQQYIEKPPPSGFDGQIVLESK